MTTSRLTSRSSRSPLPVLLVTLLAVAPVVTASASYGARATVQRAEVLSVDPLIETVEVSHPVERCHEQPVRINVVDDRRRPGGQTRAYRSRTPGVVGAILGGAIGHSVGNGKTNKRIGTAVGAILGGSIGADISRRNQRRAADDWRSQEVQNYHPVRYRTERVCEVVADTRLEQRIRGYDVAYAFAGETYTTVLDYDPGRYLDVRVQVTPVD